MQSQINDTTEDIKSLNKKLAHLQNNMTNNNNNAKRLQLTADKLKQEANNTYQDSISLQTDYNIVQNDLDNKLKKIRDSKGRAEELFTKALALMGKVTKTEREMAELDSDLQENKLKELENTIQTLIDRMNAYTKIIDQKSIYYSTCT